jgi:hypothetical protein
VVNELFMAAGSRLFTNKRNLKRRVLVLCTLGALLVVAVVAIALYSIRAKSEQLYIAGSSLNSFFATLAEEVKNEDIDAILDFYSEDFRLKKTDLWTTSPIYESEGMKILEWGVKPVGDSVGNGLADNYTELFKASDKIDFAKFKIEMLDIVNKKTADIDLLMWFRGNRSEGAFELKSLFRLRVERAWSKDWVIVDQRLIRGRTVIGDRTGFSNETEAAGLDFKSHPNPMYQMADWRPDVFEIIKYAHGGVSTADYDNDGWYDIFFGDGKHPKLFRNTGGGQFDDVTEEAGLPATLVGVHVALFVDLDNDGDKDLFLGRSTGLNQLYRNNGDGTFSDVTEGAGLGGYWVPVASAADFDNDGLIDLYVGRYLDPRKNLPATPFYTRNGEGNSLLRNLGDFRFEDVTESAGVREGGLALGAAWGDYDRDEDLDLYVANDFGRNAFFENNGDGTFTDRAPENGTIDIAFGMSASFADANNDGNLDLLVSNIHSSQRWFGNVATLKNYMLTSVREGAMLEDGALFKEMADVFDDDISKLGDRIFRGNSLLLNDANGRFADVSELAGVNPHGWFWGSLMFDYDNDGLMDSYQVNGWITGKEFDDL